MLERDFVSLLVSIIEGMILKNECLNQYATNSKCYKELIEELGRLRRRHCEDFCNY